MKNKIQFNSGRLILMLKHDFNKYWKRILLIIGGAFAAATVIALFFVMTGDGHMVANEMHTVLYPMILIWVGLFLSSLSFKDLNADAERLNYLSLPASHLEKYLSRYILTGIVLPIFISIAYCIYAFIYDTAVLTMLDGGITRFSFFTNIFEGYNPTSFDFLKFYLPLHSIAFLGAITFRKIHFFKTLIVGGFIIMMFSAIIYFLGKIILPELYTGWTLLNVVNVQPNEWSKNLVENYGRDVIYGISMLVIPIIFWVAGYFKLTEKEV